MRIILSATFYFFLTSLTFLLTLSNVYSSNMYKNFSKVTIKVEGKEKIESIIAYNTFYNLNPKFAKFKFLIDLDDICIGKMMLKKLSTFKFMCSSGYTASGTYYPSKNAIDEFGKGTDSNGKKFLFRLEGEDFSLKNHFERMVRLVNDKNLIKKTEEQITQGSSGELEKEKQKRKDLEQKLASLKREKQKFIEEQRKRKDLEKKLAALQSEKKKQIKKAKQNEIGSGFYVSKFRHIVTNQHVVNKCKKITVGHSMKTQISADLIASDKRNDLAILQTVSMEMASADTKSFVQKLSIQIVPILTGGLMRSEDVVGGEEIFVAGYPLGNMVSDQMKLTDGIVSATKGLDNDVSQFEISSVVRKGNSGGPIYDKKGNIVGVAVSRLNVNRTDTINFGIKGSTVKQFLSAHDIPSKWSNRQDKIDTKDIYKIASKQAIMVVCHR